MVNFQLVKLTLDYLTRKIFRVISILEISGLGKDLNVLNFIFERLAMECNQQMIWEVVDILLLILINCPLCNDHAKTFGACDIRGCMHVGETGITLFQHSRRVFVFSNNRLLIGWTQISEAIKLMRRIKWVRFWIKYAA